MLRRVFYCYLSETVLNRHPLINFRYGKTAFPAGGLTSRGFHTLAHAAFVHPMLQHHFQYFGVFIEKQCKAGQAGHFHFYQMLLDIQ